MPQGTQTLSAAQIKQYAYAAGFRGSDLDTAVAIAQAESSGNPLAYNPELASSYSRPGGGSRGLWQIFGSVHPEYNSSLAFDPATNAAAAYKLYRQAGNKFTDWTTYTSGAYKKYLGSAASAPSGNTLQGIGLQVATGGVISPGLVSAIGGGGSAGGGISFDPGAIASTVTTSVGNAILGKTSAGVQRTTTDLMFFLVGIVLVIIGLVALFLRTEPGQRVVAVGGEAAKLAAVGAL